MPPLESLSEFTGRIRRWFSPATEALPLGAALPDLEVLSDQGTLLRLNAERQGWALVYFFPRAETPGCTAQACSLRDAYAELHDRGVRIFGVSFDRPEALRLFRETHRLPFTFLSDPDGNLANAFGVPHLMGIAKRQTFLFRDGVLVWRDLQASTTRQAADVLQKIDSAD